MRPHWSGREGWLFASPFVPSPRPASMTPAVEATAATSISVGAPAPPPHPPPNPLRDFFAGGVAGAANLTAGYAFDTVKVGGCECVVYVCV